MFVRDRFTWLIYAVLGFLVYLQSTTGPLMPFLRDELGLSYTLSGAHLSAFAVGGFIAALRGEWLSRNLPRYVLLWGATGGVAGGAFFIIIGQHPLVTLFGMGLMGFSAGLTIMTIQAALSDHHGELRAIPLTESNTLAMLSAVIAPLAVGVLEREGLGWRTALMLGIVLYGIMFAVGHRIPVTPAQMDEVDETDHRRKRPLPPAYWAYWWVAVIVVGFEWGLAFWAASFFNEQVGLPTETASAMVSVFFVALFIGRGTGSVLARRYDIGRLLVASALLTAVSFPLYWLAPVAPLNIAGFFLTGLGVANFYPLTLACALKAAPRQGQAANARLILAGSVAVLIVPQFIGTAADLVGIHGALAVLALMSVTVIGLIVVANRRLAGPRVAALAAG
ncbi:MAG: hypothetical protein OHK0046_46640 [Anaerolineae bacterium]